MNAPIYTMRGVDAYKNRRNPRFEVGLERLDCDRDRYDRLLADARPVLDRAKNLTDKFDEPALPLWLALLLTAVVGFCVGRWL